MPDPEKQKPTQPEQAPQGTETVPEEPAKSFKAREEEMIGKLEEAYGKRVSAGSDKVTEIPLDALNKKKAEQKKEITDLFEQHRKEWESEVKKENVSSRENLAAQILDSATQEAQKKIQQIEGVLDASKGEQTYMDDAAISKMMVDSQNIEKLAQEDKKAQEIAEKLLQKQELADADYQYVISKLQPYDIQTQLSDGKSTCDATSSGILIGFMRPDQRYKVVELFMASARSAETPQLIDAFVCTKVLTGIQAETLLKGHQYLADFKAKCENGYYAGEIKKYEKMIAEISARTPSGNYADGTMDRVCGRPLLGGLLAIWGAIVTGLNVAANWRNKKDWVKNPYIYMGAAAMLGGTEIASGTMKKGAPWFGAGAIGTGLDNMSETEEQKKSETEKRNREMIAKIIDPVQSPAELIEYLDGGGYETMLAARRARQQKGETGEGLLITLDDLLKLEEGNPERIRPLESLAKKSEDVKKSVFNKLNQVTEAGIVIFGIEKNTDFAKLMADIRGGQREAGAVSTGSAPEGSAASTGQASSAPASPSEAPPVTSAKPPVMQPTSTETASSTAPAEQTPATPPSEPAAPPPVSPETTPPVSSGPTANPQT